MKHYSTRNRWVGIVLAVVALGVGAWCWRAEAQTLAAGPTATSQSAAGGLVTHVHESEGHPTRVIAIDPAQQVMAVYHIDQGSGMIQLKSVRKLKWDLEMIGFNSGDPSPQDLEKAHQRLE